MTESLESRASLVASLCEHLCAGNPASTWYADPANVDQKTIRRWGIQDPSIKAAVESARVEAQGVLIDQCREIADSDKPEAYPGQRKTQCWARLEAAKRINPQRYGDRQQVTGADGGGIVLRVITGLESPAAGTEDSESHG